MTEQQHRELTSKYVAQARSIKPTNAYEIFKRHDWLKRAREHFTKANNIGFFVGLGYDRTEQEAR